MLRFRGPYIGFGIPIFTFWEVVDLDTPGNLMRPFQKEPFQKEAGARLPIPSIFRGDVMSFGGVL